MCGKQRAHARHGYSTGVYIRCMPEFSKLCLLLGSPTFARTYPHPTAPTISYYKLYGADVNAWGYRNLSLETPLHAAARLGADPLVHWLLQHGMLSSRSFSAARSCPLRPLARVPHVLAPYRSHAPTQAQTRRCGTAQDASPSTSQQRRNSVISYQC